MESFYNHLNRFKGMSWADINTIVEEEEEAARQFAVLRKIITERNVLIAKGEYELEDGEEIETIT